MSQGKLPTIYTMNNAADAALNKIIQHREGLFDTLSTRFDILNQMLLGGFKFGQLVLLGGASGHGKSYLLQMLRADFMNPALNTLKRPFKLLHFNLEMPMASEIMRELVASTKYTYEDLISYGDCNRLEDQAFEEVKRHLRQMQDNDTVFFVNTPGTKYVMEETIYKFKSTFPNHELIVTLDHTLLIEMLNEKSEVQLESDIGKKFIEIRQKINSLNFLVSQLNDKIEDPRRREPGMQFPTKTDFHGSKQVYQAADVVLVAHRPELLNIELYGKVAESYPTKDMVALHLLKNREGAANMWARFTQDFANGTFQKYVAQTENSYTY